MIKRNIKRLILVSMILAMSLIGVDEYQERQVRIEYKMEQLQERACTHYGGEKICD